MARLTRICRKCGAKIFSDAPEGLCTGCVLETALGSFADTVAGATDATYADDAARGEDARTLETSVHVAAMLGELGDYELLEEIGRGGQGVVFRARQKSLNRNVALKVIGLGQWATPAHLKRFRLEAEAAASLDHPYIVPIYEVGEQDGQCYFSMKFIEGGQLDEVVKHTPISIRQAAELMAKVARTVHYAHEHGILHRDIKPGNILLDAKGEAHLTDFGLARLVESESTVTRTLEVLGTPSYMAPEQAAGDNAKLTRATDVYGLGAVLYQLLTGHPPFAGGTTYETIKLLLETEPRQPRLWNPKIDRDLSTICLKCLGKDPQRRYSSALALAEDLERWLKHEPIRARRTGVLTRGKKWVRRNPTTTVLTALLVALLAAISVIIWKSELAGRSPITGIAVLPFENASNDPNTEYLSEGISEALINSLSELQQLRVIARPTAFHYKRKDVDPRQVGRELGAAAVLTGKVRQMQDALSVQVDLVDTATGAQIWGAGYDRKIADLVAVKQAIAQEVTAKLKLKLSGEEQRRLVKRDSTNAEAYQFYLRGRYFWNKRTSDGIKQAIEHFQQSVERDPNFALGYVGLADSYTGLTFYNFAAPHEAMPKAKESAIKALTLDDTLAEAHATLAHILINYDWNSSAAEKEFKRSIELNPEYATAHQWYAIHFLTATGRLEEAVQEMKKALELDPASLVMNTFMGATLSYTGRYDEAIDQCRKTIQMDPNFAVAHWHLGLAYEQKQLLDKAIEEFRKAISLSGGSPLMKAALARAYAKAQKTHEANEMLNELNELAKRQYASAYELATIYVALGNNEEAFQLLAKAYAEHSFHLVNLNVSPHFKSVRSDPRFQDLVQRLGLSKSASNPVAAEKSIVAAAACRNILF
jgi:eukaryotic-like serine/threonine-protein kinase